MTKITQAVSSNFWDKHEYRSDNTKVFINRDGDVCMQLWNTIICRINHNNELILNNGGYTTKTSKERINGVLSKLNMYVRQTKGNWRIYDVIGDSFPFEEGVRIKL